MFDDGLKTWLVLAAHYDDEALMFGNALLSLVAKGRRIVIAVLTDVAHTNPPRTPEQLAGEPQRQARRLAAFAKVCERLQAEPVHFNCPQLANDGNAAAKWDTEIDAREELLTTISWLQPDAIITHGQAGEYTAEKYANGWQVAREQHAFASRLCDVLSGMAVYRREPNGSLVVPFDAEKVGLLEHYRIGCTQTPTWDAEKLYPEFVYEPERYSLIS